MKHTYTKQAFKQQHIFVEASGTLPDLPGWILGHPSEVETKIKMLSKMTKMSVRPPTRLRRSLFASKEALNSIFSREYALCNAEFNIQHRIGSLMRFDDHHDRGHDQGHDHDDDDNSVDKKHVKC